MVTAKTATKEIYFGSIEPLEGSNFCCALGDALRRIWGLTGFRLTSRSVILVGNTDLLDNISAVEAVTAIKAFKAGWEALDKVKALKQPQLKDYSP